MHVADDRLGADGDLSNRGRLVPGVAVSTTVLAGIDTNAEGLIPETEGNVFAEQVLQDLSLSIDGNVLRPQLLSVDFPKLEQMKEGLGEIKIEFAAKLNPGGSNRKIVFENHDQPGLFSAATSKDSGARADSKR